MDERERREINSTNMGYEEVGLVNQLSVRNIDDVETF